jgi:hypothetical protein
LLCVVRPRVASGAGFVDFRPGGGSQGAAVPGAQVALSAEAGAPRSTLSASDGTFSFQGVAPGRYTIRVEAGGFVPATQPVDHGTSGQTVSVSLQVAGIKEDVSVTGALLGTAATGKTTLPLRELPMTINTLSADLIAQQGTNDLVTALQNVPGVNPFTTYGVYEYYAFRGFLDSVQLLDGVRNEGNRVNAQLTGIERVDVLKGPSSALYGGGALGATVNIIREEAVRGFVLRIHGGGRQLEHRPRRVRGRRTSRQRRSALPVRCGRRQLEWISKRGRHACHGDTVGSVAPRHQRSGQRLLHVQPRSICRRCGVAAGRHGPGVPVKANIPDVPHDRNYRTPRRRDVV